jgi:hypothetical protein
MAGQYEDYAGWRIPYDIDGTRVFQISGGVSTEATTDEIVALNDESVVTTVDKTLSWAWVFPSRRVLSHVMVYTDGGGTFLLEFSDDSTDGVNGTWSEEPWEILNATGTTPNVYRTGIRRVNQPCKALRISNIGSTSSGVGLAMVHLFGDYDYSLPVDSLVFWHPTLDSRLSPSYFDYGDVVKGSSEDLKFRLRNLSRSLIAADVVVYFDSLIHATPPVEAGHLASEDGVVFRSIYNAGDIGPSSVSGTIIVRRVTSRNAQSGLWAFRVRASAASWEPVGS